MSSMVDTHILSYGLWALTGQESPKQRIMVESSKRLIRLSKVVKVSSATWTEICRFKAPNGERIISRLAPKIRVIPLSGAIASRAAELLEQRNRPESVCKKCLNSKSDANQCIKCNKFISPQQRLVDAMIAATAESTRDVDTLYSYDTGVLDFSQYVKRINIVEPQLDHGPLWERLKRNPDDANPSTAE